MTKTVFVLAAGLIALVLTGCQPTTTSSPAPVPAEYQATYEALQSQLVAFTALPLGNVSAGTTVLSSGLEAADGNAMYPGVLQSKLLSTATTMVQRMKAMGETGVTIQTSFPLLVSSFPDSSEYTTFYQDIANVVHQEGMTLTVEENPLFGNMSSIPIASYYDGLTLQGYESADQQMAQTIIDVMHPTYLSILNEPDTYTAVIGQPGIDLTSAPVGVAFVNAVMTGLDKDGTLVGAGTGTWTDPSYDQALINQTRIDFVDMHVYPIAESDLTNMTSQVAEAAAAHTPILESECWLYKGTTNGQPDDGPQAAPDEQKVITYSFWEPLDEEFLTTMVDYARSNGFLVVSPFSTMNFFAYQTWTQALDGETSQQVRQAFDQAVLSALASGLLSSVGETYESLAKR